MVKEDKPTKYLGFLMNFNMLQQKKVVKEILQVKGTLIIWNLEKHYLAGKNLGC